MTASAGDGPATHDAATVTGVGATSTDVARLAGVSQATVSRVISGSTAVSEPTRTRVLAAMESLGYAPNLLARAMKTRRTGSIGVVVSELRNPFYPEALDEVGAALASEGLRMVLFNTDAGEGAALETIRQRLIDGVVFTSGSSRSAALQEAVAVDAPFVLLNRSVAGLAGDQVTSDNAAGAAAVAAHLVDAGHRRIAFLGGHDPSGDPSTVAERRAAFAAALERLGRRLDPSLTVFGGLGFRSGADGIERLLALPDPPTAVFCANDITAIGALETARARGVDVPGALSIVGYDDIEAAGWHSLRLTTVRQPLDRMARRAVELLVSRIADPARPGRHERFPADLVVRATSGPAPSGR